MRRVLAIVCFVCVAPSSTLADPLRLAAAYDPRPSFGNEGLGDNYFHAQSVTITQGGTLASLELLLYRLPPHMSSGASVNVWLLPMIGAQPSNDFGASLATGVIAANELPVRDDFALTPFTAVRLSNRVELVEGQRLAIAVWPNDNFGLFWGWNQDNPYSGGEFHARAVCGTAGGSGCEWFTVQSEEPDMGFRIFVGADAPVPEPEPAPVPEPATVLLASAGMLAVCTRRRVTKRLRRQSVAITED